MNCTKVTYTLCECNKNQEIILDKQPMDCKELESVGLNWKLIELNYLCSICNTNKATLYEGYRKR